MSASDIPALEYYRGDKKCSQFSVKFTGAVPGTLQKWASLGNRDTSGIREEPDKGKDTSKPGPDGPGLPICGIRRYFFNAASSLSTRY